MGEQKMQLRSRVAWVETKINREMQHQKPEFIISRIFLGTMPDKRNAVRWKFSQVVDNRISWVG